MVTRREPGEAEGRTEQPLGPMLRPNFPALALLLPLAAACALTPAPSGKVLFDRNCAICHGRTGAGDGPQADALPLPPANLRGIAAANDGVFPAERVMATIYGYRGKDFAALMPEFGPVLDSPPVDWTAPSGEVIETPRDLVALTKYLETLQDL